MIFHRGRPDEMLAAGENPLAMLRMALSPFQGALGSEDLSRSDLFKCADVLFSHVRRDKPRCGSAQEAPPERGRRAAARSAVARGCAPGASAGILPRLPRCICAEVSSGRPLKGGDGRKGPPPKSSEAISVGRGRAAERMSFRACEEANDVELVRTTARGFLTKQNAPTKDYPHPAGTPPENYANSVQLPLAKGDFA